MEKSKDNSTPSMAVVIPTRNRIYLLNQILDDLANQILKPKIVVIVDSSDIPLAIKRNDLNLVVIHSIVKSAAIQRNLGLDYLVESKNEFDFCAFLDDDVRISRDYLSVLVNTICNYPSAIGISGLAIADNETKFQRNWLLDLVGFSGPEGTITQGAINVPVRKERNVIRVEWLIGCSLWKFSCLETLRFQKDFFNQSIFEDVIFSVQASKFGDLLVNPKVRLRHLFAQENRPKTFNHYNSWVKNRYRLRNISPAKFSIPKFIFVNLSIAFKLLFQGKVSGVLGIVLAMLSIGHRK